MKNLTRMALVLALAGMLGSLTGCEQTIRSSPSYASSSKPAPAPQDKSISRNPNTVAAAIPPSSSSGWSAPSNSPASSSSARAKSASFNTPAAPPANDPRFTTPAALPAAHPPANANPAPVSPATRRLNLYGELEETGPAAGSQLDGSTNLVQVSFATEGACVDPDIDRTGSLLVFASTVHRKTSDVYLKSVNGRTLTQITSDPADDVMPAFSPDATKIAFASNRAGNWDIYITGIDGGPATQITTESDHELHPSWSPDGRSLAYCRFGTQSGRWEIWVTDVANPGVKRFLDYGVFPEWCPDVARSKIVFQRAKQRGSRDYSIWTIDVVNGQASQPTEIVSAANAALINPAWAPDGSRIVFVAVVDPQEDRARPRQSDVWLVNVDGTNRINLTSGQFANFQPVWAGDGSVYFVSDRSGVDNLWAMKAGSQQPIGTNGAMQADGSQTTQKPQPTGIANADNSGSNDSPHP